MASPNPSRRLVLMANGLFFLLFATDILGLFTSLKSHPKNPLPGHFVGWAGGDWLWVLGIGIGGLVAHGLGTRLFQRWVARHRFAMWRSYHEAMAIFVEDNVRTYFAARVNRVYGMVLAPLLEEVFSRWVPLLVFYSHPILGVALVLFGWFSWSVSHVSQLTGSARRLRVVELLVFPSWLYLGLMVGTFLGTHNRFAPLLASTLAHALHNALYFYSLRYRRLLSGSG